jgi:hypothetical protein
MFPNNFFLEISFFLHFENKKLANISQKGNISCIFNLGILEPIQNLAIALSVAETKIQDQ